VTRRLAEAARTVDARSTRSRQRKVGASEIGVCRRRAGYSHHGTPYSDPENVSGVAAINGTWIHKGALDTMRREWGSIIETRVEDDVLRGHVDAIELPNEWRVRAGLDPHPLAPDVIEVDDLKTKRDGRLVGFVRVRGPKRSELFQAHLYAGLLRRGKVSDLKRFAHLAGLGELPVELIRLRYWSRAGDADDDVQEYVYEQPFDPDIEAEAREWVDQVASSTSPEELPRDQDGPGLSIVCDNCPFLTACWGEAGDRAPQSLLIVTDADLAETLAEYDAARADAAAATERKDLARAKLDATERAIYTDGRRAFKLGWSGGNAREPVPDLDAMLALFERAKIEVPMKERGPSARTLSVTPWEVPEVTCGKPIGETVFQTEDGWTFTQDRPRGGWTATTPDEETVTKTAGQFAKLFPDFVDPRPTCILKKSHSGACWPAEDVRVLDVPDDATEAAGG
jgi:hypothetical protein